MKDFEVGDEAHYMNGDKPVKNKITAKLLIDGKIGINTYSSLGETGKKNQLFYQVDGYIYKTSDLVFKTKEALRDSVFGKE